MSASAKRTRWRGGHRRVLNATAQALAGKTVITTRRRAVKASATMTALTMAVGSRRIEVVAKPRSSHRHHPASTSSHFNTFLLFFADRLVVGLSHLNLQHLSPADPECLLTAWGHPRSGDRSCWRSAPHGLTGQ